MATPVSPVKVDLDVTVDRSCNNWKCCFGCRKVKVEDTQEKPITPESISINMTIEKTVRTYETHHKHKGSKEQK